MALSAIVESLSQHIPLSPYFLAFSLVVAIALLIVINRLTRNAGPSISFSKAPRASLEDRAVGVLLGTAVGDAKGVPFIGMSKEAIQAVPATPRQVYAPVPPTHPQLRDAAVFAPGSWTDVTLATLAAARALAAGSDTDGAAFAAEYRKSTEGSQARVGGAGPTLAALAAPALVYSAHKTSPTAEQLAAAVPALLVPDSPAAALPFALIHLRALVRLFSQENPEYFNSKEARLQFLTDVTKDARQIETAHKVTDRVSPRLEQLRAALDSDALSDERICAIASPGGDKAGYGSLLTLVYGLWAHRPPQFTSVVKGALLGGVAPHAAAGILGGMLGGMRGKSMVPPHYRDALQSNPTLLTEAAETLAVSLSRRGIK